MLTRTFQITAYRILDILDGFGPSGALTDATG